VSDLNVQQRDEKDSIAPYAMPHKPDFIGLMIAAEFRRTRARSAAVSYGTATNSGIPLTSSFAVELAHYHNYLVKQAENDIRSEELLEEFEILRINAETISLRIRNEDLPLEEKQQLLNELTDLVAEIDKKTQEMEELARD